MTANINVAWLSFAGFLNSGGTSGLYGSQG